LGLVDSALVVSCGSRISSDDQGLDNWILGRKFLGDLLEVFFTTSKKGDGSCGLANARRCSCHQDDFSFMAGHFVGVCDVVNFRLLNLFLCNIIDMQEDGRRRANDQAGSG
jgi:hypothetical protein